MRPVQRPDIEETHTTYSSYLEPLIRSFGQYCSYCERWDKLDVEHVVPKTKAPHLKTEWDNLLLGCARCNRDFKKNKNDKRDGYLWPDTHNTFRAFTYESTGRVLVNPELDDETRQAAENLKKLVKLDDGQTNQPVLNYNRQRVFKMALKFRELFTQGFLDLDGLMSCIHAAPAWSVWMTVFADVPEVKSRLLNDSEFPGTAQHHFEGIE